jgi:starch phosphorylase
VSSLPDRISRLDELARDLWWSWTPEARNLFRTLDYAVWRSTAHNPVRMLQTIGADALARAVTTPAWLDRYDQVLARFDAMHRNEHTWYEREAGDPGAHTIAYFSAEFALHQSLPLYAGGLGVLAGDHCKEASDLGVPLVGVGFMYPQGYFHQRLTADGWQEETYERLNWAEAAIEPALTPDGRPCITAVPLANRSVLVAAWLVRLGRTRLLLLDTSLEENAPGDRELSARLYGGNHDTRAQQEVVLGIGGVRVLQAMGIEPTVYHLNEGHAAFVALQRIRDLCERGASFDAALSEVRRTTVFTTHTPVPAGHDAFPSSLVESLLADAWGTMGPHRARFLALGDYDNGSGPMFNMTALALRTSGAANGVSLLHGEVTRQMWQPIWPELPAARVPVTSITNGVHVPTWIAAELDELLREYAGDDWRDRCDSPELGELVAAIPDDALWRARQALRSFLLTFMTERTRERWTRGDTAHSLIVTAGTMFERQALTIGFARRFTAYKRPELIFADPARLARILNAAGRPVQMVFAGKAHPADDAGKHHLQQIFRRALDPAFGGRVAFLEGYDLHVAHFLVQGCDVWLNTPRKPLEASGTSGMKAAINGTLNLSIGDGWWAEGFTGTNGWLIEGKSQGTDPGAQDWADASALYDLLEFQVVPAFYERDAAGRPRRWLQMVRQSIATVLPRFSAQRMVKEYVQKMYVPAIRGAQVSK